MTDTGYSSHRTRLRWLGGCWAVLLLLSPAGLRGQETIQVTVYTLYGAELRSINAPRVVDVGPTIPFHVPSAVTGTGQGKRVRVDVIVSEGVGGTPAQGLTRGFVRKVVADPYGNVWGITRTELSRFDGERWTTFITKEDWISDIEVDPQGHLWLIGAHGVTRFDGKNWYLHQIAGGENDIELGPNGDVWTTGHIHGMIYRFDGQDWWAYGHEDGIPKGQVSGIAIDKSGTLWANLFPTQEYSIISFDGQKWISYQIADEDDWGIHLVFADRKNRVWIGAGPRLYVRENRAWINYGVLGRMYSLYEDRYGRIWLAGYGYGFGVLDSTSWTVFPYNVFKAHSVAMDDGGNLWIASGIRYGSVIKWDSSDLPPAPPTSVASETDEGAPRSFDLFQNHPNPFNSETQIAFHLPRTEHLSLEIFSLTGQSVATLMEGVYPAGRYQIPWDGRDDRGNPAGSGIFFYRLTTETLQSTRTMVLIK